MVKVYKVEFSLDAEEIENRINENVESEDEQVTVDQDVLGGFHVLAYDIASAFLEADDFLKRNFQEKQYDIVKLEEERGINVVNYEGDQECDCPYCAVAHTVPDQILSFDCPYCKKKLTVADNGWETIRCEGCGEELDRKWVKLSNGKFVYDLKSAKKSKKDNGKNTGPVDFNKGGDYIQ